MDKKWYVIHTYSGHENKVKTNLEKAIHSAQLEDKFGQILVATEEFVEMKDGATFDETALRKHCRESLAQFKVPRDIRMIEKLPRNPTGKIMRRELKSLV